MNNTDQLSQILTIALFALVVILGALLFVYAVLVIKNRKSKKNNKKTKSTNDTNSSNDANIKEGKAATYTKASVFDFMEFDKIEDNMIIQKDGKRFVMILQCQGINYDLLSEAEKVGVEEGFLQFLNTLRYPIQIYIQTRTVNLDKSLIGYRKNVETIERELNKLKTRYEANKTSGEVLDEDLEKQYFEIVKQTNMLEYGKDIIASTERMSKNRNVLNNKYYMVIYYYPEEINEHKTKYEIQEDAFSELYTRAQTIIRTLYACSVSAKVMDSQELAELMYVAYNRDESEVFDFETLMKSGYTELYSTAQDVWDKRIKQLNKEIEERAIEIANETIEEVKSDRQKQYELKHDSMEDLAREMAEMIIKENDDYIGKDIATEAIEKLNSKLDDLEDESEDEEESKPKPRRGRTRKAV